MVSREFSLIATQLKNSTNRVLLVSAGLLHPKKTAHPAARLHRYLNYGLLTLDAGELDESEEVFDVELPSRDEPAEVVHPGEESFDLPALLIAAKLAPVLGFASVATVGRDHLDAVFVLEPLVELVRVVSLVPDQSGRELVEKASGKNFFNKLALGRRSARDRYGERKTVASGDSDDLRALAPACRADGEAPFFALAKVASTNASSRLSLPCA